MRQVVPLGSARRSVPAPRLALLGTGVVGGAFVARHHRLRQHNAGLPALGWLANSRTMQACADGPGEALRTANAAPRGSIALLHWAETDALRRGDIVVDATASDSVAARYARWLGRGVHVVTANKLGNGATQARADAIATAIAATGARYGDSATVGAGLPLLHSLRALVAGGDRIHRIEGVLSGSLAWLFNNFDGTRAFSWLIGDALQRGYTEPDPRVDLSGEDVRRKLMILARAAGIVLRDEDVQVDSLLALAAVAAHEAAPDRSWSELDAPLSQRLREARRAGQALRFLGRVDAHGASVGLFALQAQDPLMAGSGSDNCVAIYSDRYAEQPLLIQGPGAGAEVTAAALLDDVLRAVQR